MLETGLERLEVAGEGLVRLGDGTQGDMLAVFVQVVAEDEGMVALLGGLDHVPVGVAVEALLLVVVRKGHVQVGAVQLGVDLLVEELVNLLVHGCSFLDCRGACTLPTAPLCMPPL